MMRKMIWLLFLVPIITKKSLNFSEFIDSTPEKFGILTYSHSKIGDYKQIKNHVEKYANMECSSLSQVSIVQIGQQYYDGSNFTSYLSFKRPLYFINKPYGSVDFRFYIPPQSQADIYFLIDVGSIVECDQLTGSFDQWKKKALGDLGPIVSISGESFSFNTAKSEFQQVQNGSAKRYFNLNLLNGAWVSRFYLELYYFQTCLQIKKIRQIVIKQNDCQDIALNFMVYSFFSEFLPQLIGLNIFLKQDKLQRSKNSFQIRNMCFKNFVNIIGFNPMRIIDKKRSIKQSYAFQSKKYIVYAKRRELQMRMKNQLSEIFINEKNQKTLIQKIFIDQNLSALVEEKRRKLEQLRQNRDSLIKKRKEDNQEYHKSLKVILVVILIFLAIMIFVNSKLIQKYKKLMKLRQESQRSVKNNAENQLKPI